MPNGKSKTMARLPPPPSWPQVGQKNPIDPIRLRNRCLITSHTGYVVFFKLQATAVFFHNGAVFALKITFFCNSYKINKDLQENF